MVFYGVQKGKYGAAVYTSWDKCKEATHGVSGAKFKRFETEKEAENFAFGKKQLPDSNYNAILYTDGSYFNDFEAGYATVFVKGNKAVAVLYGPCLEKADTHNVAGEIEAAKRGLEKALALGMESVKVVHDYEGVGAWPDNEWTANKDITVAYKEFVSQIRKSMHVDFQKVAGHSGNPFNELADEYAKKGALAEKETYEELDGSVSGRQLVCPSCGSQVEEGASFCEFCGVIFDEKIAPTSDGASDKESCVMTSESDSNPSVFHCRVCGKGIRPGEPVYKVKALDFDQAPPIVEDVCCSKACAEHFVDGTVEFLSDIYDEIVGQNLHEEIMEG